MTREMEETCQKSDLIPALNRTAGTAESKSRNKMSTIVSEGLFIPRKQK